MRRLGFWLWLASVCWLVGMLLGSAAVALSAEPSLRFDTPVTWTLDDGTLASVMLRKIPGETKRAEFLVAKPGNPPVLRFYVLLLDDQPVPPPPPPPPPPVMKAAYLYIIHESKDDEPAHAAVWNSKLLADTCQSVGITLGTYDQDAAEKVYPNATKRARDKGLPAGVFLDKAGQVLAVESLAATPDAMATLVKKYAGGAK